MQPACGWRDDSTWCPHVTPDRGVRVPRPLAPARLQMPVRSPADLAGSARAQPLVLLLAPQAPATGNAATAERFADILQSYGLRVMSRDPQSMLSFAQARQPPQGEGGAAVVQYTRPSHLPSLRLPGTNARSMVDCNGRCPGGRRGWGRARGGPPRHQIRTSDGWWVTRRMPAPLCPRGYGPHMDDRARMCRSHGRGDGWHRRQRGAQPSVPHAGMHGDMIRVGCCWSGHRDGCRQGGGQYPLRCTPGTLVNIAGCFVHLTRGCLCRLWRECFWHQTPCVTVVDALTTAQHTALVASGAPAIACSLG
jgi:hypothetical protein